jgi:hypothetical protein
MRTRRLHPALLATVLAGSLLAVGATPADAAAGSKAKARWDVTSYVAGTDRLEVHGTAPGRHRRIQLQVRTKGRWITIGAHRSKRSGKFRVSAKLDWFGNHKVRVRAAGRGPRFVKAHPAAISTGYDPVGNAADYDLLGTSSATSWRFNPCRTVRYKVNADDTGQAGLDAARQAMTHISYATGIKVKYTGTTHMIPAADEGARLPRRTNLVIAWGSNAEVPAFAQLGADGLGGPRRGLYARSGGRRVQMTTQAGVTLLTDSDGGYYTPGFESSGTPGVGHLLLHEIGHAFGLDHSAGADEMMFGGAWSTDADGIYRSRLAFGDLAGMSKVGLGQGCLRPINGRFQARVQAPSPLS